MKKKIFTLLSVVFALAMSTSVAFADPPPSDKDTCTKIQEGTLTYSDGHFFEGTPLMTGYDLYGYNYQAHMFSGSYANVYLGAAGFPPYTGDDDAYLNANPEAENHWAWPNRSTQLLMKWDQDWLANVDCDGDGMLDRHMDTSGYIGSGAWETNHMWDTYEMEGQSCTWDYFTKIVAVPVDANLIDGVWYSPDGTEIGPVIWGEFATLQSVYNDPCGGFTGIEYLSSDHAGFGGW